jgi:hypothetical protein
MNDTIDYIIFSQKYKKFAISKKTSKFVRQYKFVFFMELIKFQILIKILIKLYT